MQVMIVSVKINYQKKTNTEIVFSTYIILLCSRYKYSRVIF